MKNPISYIFKVLLYYVIFAILFLLMVPLTVLTFVCFGLNVITDVCVGFLDAVFRSAKKHLKENRND